VIGKAHLALKLRNIDYSGNNEKLLYVSKAIQLCFAEINTLQSIPTAL